MRIFFIVSRGRGYWSTVMESPRFSPRGGSMGFLWGVRCVQAAKPWGVWCRSAGYCCATCASWWWWLPVCACACVCGWTTAVAGVTVPDDDTWIGGSGVWGCGAWRLWLWPATRLLWLPPWLPPLLDEVWLWWWCPKTTPEKATGHWWCFVEPFAWCACATTWWLEGGACAVLGWWWLPVAAWWFALLALLLLLLLLFCCCDCRWLFFLFFIRRFWNQILTWRSVRFRLRASSHRFCFDT